MECWKDFLYSPSMYYILNSNKCIVAYYSQPAFIKMDNTLLLFLSGDLNEKTM